MADRPATARPSMPPTGSALPTDRYGRAPSPAERRRRVVAAVVVAALVGLAALGWVAQAILGVQVRTQDVGFAVVDDGAVDVTFVVAAAPGSVSECRVRALSPSFAEVGARDVVVGPSRHEAVRVTARVATTERATTGLVQRCRVAQSPREPQGP